MKRLFLFIALAILLAELTLFGLSDAAISVANVDTRSNDVTSSTSNSSASATITMYAVADE